MFIKRSFTMTQDVQWQWDLSKSKLQNYKYKEWKKWNMNIKWCFRITDSETQEQSCWSLAQKKEGRGWRLPTLSTKNICVKTLFTKNIRVSTFSTEYILVITLSTTYNWVNTLSTKYIWVKTICTKNIKVQILSTKKYLGQNIIHQEI